MASDLSSNVQNAGPLKSPENHQRGRAVAAALEVIAARASSSAPVNLEQEFDNLSKYADQIQEALKTK